MTPETGFNLLYRGVLIVTVFTWEGVAKRTKSFNPLYRGVSIVTAGAGFLNMRGPLRDFANISFI